MEDNGDTFSDLRWKTVLHKSQKQWQMFQRKLQGTNLLQNFFLVSFYTHAFLLPSSILDCLILDYWHDHKTLDTRHTGKVHILLGVRTKKVPLSVLRHNVLNFLVIWLYCCFSDGVVMLSCFRYVSFVSKDGAVMLGPDLFRHKIKHKKKSLP